MMSLLTAIIQKKNLDINPILKSMELNDIYLISKLLQILEVYLMIDTNRVDTLDHERLF
jgi:hypothetical protein